MVVQRERGGRSPRFAPLYDSARGLFCNLTDDILTECFHCREGLQWLTNYVTRSRPLVGFRGLVPKNGRRYVTHIELITAVYKEYPDQQAVIRGIFEAFNWRQVHSTLMAELGAVCSPRRIDLMRICLHKRQQALLQAIGD